MARNGKRKGRRISPSPPPLPAPARLYPDKYILSFLKKIPEASRDQVAVLSLKEREALAYLIKTPRKRCSRIDNIPGVPDFSCECLDCYSDYWSRCNSSPNCNLITEAIEAFEQTLSPEELRNRGRKGSKGRPGNAADEEDAVQESQAAPATARIHHTAGFAWKLLADLRGLFNSRIWKFWNKEDKN